MVLYKKKYTKKKNNDKKYSKSVSKFTPIRRGIPSGVNVNRLTNMRYTTPINLSSSTGGLANIQFNANDLYDPEVATGGHQPMGYDTMSSLFNHYVVVGAKISIQLSRNSGTSPIITGIYLGDDTNFPYSYFIGVKGK